LNAGTPLRRHMNPQRTGLAKLYQLQHSWIDVLLTSLSPPGVVPQLLIDSVGGRVRPGIYWWSLGRLAREVSNLLHEAE
jgi:hypothetical protein